MTVGVSITKSRDAGSIFVEGCRVRFVIELLCRVDTRLIITSHSICLHFRVNGRTLKVTDCRGVMQCNVMQMLSSGQKLIES